MAARTGFLDVHRHTAVRRAPAERVRDYREVYLPLPLQAVQDQASRCMDCGVPFCHHGCPLGNLIPEWNDLTRRGEWHEAVERLHATNNFPEFTGRLCPAPCEPACVLDINDSPVAIKQVEQSIIDTAFDRGWVRAHPPSHRTGSRVGVVGSGPAGLAAAQQLNRAGHHVTVYERADAPGGLLRYGIPDFKMEKRVLDRRLALLEAEGIVFETGCEAGVDISAAQLKRDHDALVLALGAEAARDVDLPGRSLGGIHLAMDYLVQQNRRVAGLPEQGDVITARGKRVVIIGGGDTGADCLGNVLREECASVQQLYLYPQPDETRPPDTPWPQWPRVLRTYAAHEEGGSRDFAVMATGFEGELGPVCGVRSVRVEQVAGTAPGHGQTVRPVPGTERTLPADLVLLAIGFAGVREQPLVRDLGVRLTARRAIAVDAELATGVDRVFAAGDARRGAHLIVTAIADGRAAARACDRALMGTSLLL